MITHGRLYKFLAIFLSLTLITSTFPAPVWADMLGLPPHDDAANDVNTDVAQAIQTTLPPELAELGLFDPPSQTDNTPLSKNGPGISGLSTEPATLANPLSISHIQSAYRATDIEAGMLLITFTVTNNQPPTIIPDFPFTTTTDLSTYLTETLNILSNFDYTNDPNTIHNVLLVDTLAPPATFVSASPAPDHRGDEYAWNLGHIPPMGSVTATLKINVTSDGTTFMDLDMGAAVWGTLQGRSVHTQARPVALVPDTIAGQSSGQWLQWTVDADKYDEYMLAKTAELSQNPLALFAYVRSLGYESYEGSLRGTRGTLWSQAGNSLDQASLLIAMLRASGVPSRYVRGTLSLPLAQELILSMFPQPTGTLGHVPPGTETADPANDPLLLAEVQDHWWVEAYLEGEWVSLDPSFSLALPGDAFATPTETWAEIPDSHRHKVTARLKIERFESFLSYNGTLPVSYPLAATFNTVELAGKPLNLGFSVTNKSTPGLVFAVVEHSFVPYFIVGDPQEGVAIEGTPFHDLFSNFPLGFAFTVGVWLEVETRDPNGRVQLHEREIKDKIGVDARLNGGTVSVAPGAISYDTPPLLNESDIAQIHVLSYRAQSTAITQQQYARLSQRTKQVAADGLRLQALDAEQDAAEIRRLQQKFFFSAQEVLSSLALIFQQEWGTASDAFDQSFMTHSYPAQPQILLLSQTAVPETEKQRFSFELLAIKERVLSFPGQAAASAIASHFAQSIAAKTIETDLMQEFTSVLGPNTAAPPTSALLILDEAEAADIDLVLINSATLDALAQLSISNEAKARINKAVTANEDINVLVPRQMVLVEGEPQLGWLEINAATGYVSPVLENGSRASTFLGYIKLSELGTAGAFRNAALLNALFSIFYPSLLFTFLYVLGTVPKNFGMPAPPGLKGNKAAAAALAYGYLAYFCFQGWAIHHASLSVRSPSTHVFTKAAAIFSCTVGTAVLSGVVASFDPPLPAAYYNQQPLPASPQAEAEQTIAFTKTETATAIDASLNTSLVATSNDLQAAWSSSAQQILQFDTLQTTNATLYADGVVLETGDLQIASSTLPLTAAAQGGPLHVSVSGTGNNSFYAPAVTDIGMGSTWLTYTAHLTASQPHTLLLNDAILTVNNSQTYTGSFTLVVTGTTDLTGHGPTAAANFAPDVSLSGQNATLRLGPASGTVTIGGSTIDASSGLALTDYTGPIAITEATATTDQVDFTGTADFFGLTLTPASTTTSPQSAVTFQATIAANMDDTYLFTVAGPSGWQVEIDNTGTIIATPPVGTTPDTYHILVTAQSTTTPDAFVSAVHTVTTTALQVMALTVQEDPLITIPMGQTRNEAANFIARGVDPFGHVNNGQAQVPQAAYTVLITNPSTLPHTFNVSITGLPPEWIILSGAEGSTNTTLSLPAGGAGQVGFYISPDQAALLAPGTTYNVTVQAAAVDNPSLQESDTILFTMPQVAFPYLAAKIDSPYTTPGTPVRFKVGLTNVGNIAGNFPVTVTAHNILYNTSPLSPAVTIAPDTFTTAVLTPEQTVTRTITFTPTGGTEGQVYWIAIRSQAPQAVYRPVTYLRLMLVNPAAFAAYEAAALLEAVAADTTIPTEFDQIGVRITDLLTACQSGTNAIQQRDRLVTALQNAAAQLATLLPHNTAVSDLAQLADQIATHTTCPDLLNDISQMGILMTTLTTDLQTTLQYGPRLRFVPGAAVTLPGRAVAYTLEISNRDALTATYPITLTYPGGEAVFTTTLLAGESQAYTQVVTPTAVGIDTIRAQASVVGREDIQVQAQAGLNVVDALLNITDVSVTPGFVETGHSSTSLSIQVANQANWRMAAQATTHLFTPGGSQILSRTQPIVIALNPADNSFDLGAINTGGLAPGVYSISVTIDVLEPDILAALPSAQGYAQLSVGQGIKANIEVSPETVAPGTAIVTTTIATERTTFGPGGGDVGGGTPSLTQTLYLTAPTHVGNNNPAVGPLLQLEAGTYDVIISDGAVQFGLSRPWYANARVSVFYTTTLAQEYYLGTGIDALTTGSPTRQEAIARNQGKFVRVYLSQPADVRFWIQDNTPADDRGALTLTVRRMFTASTSLNRQVEGALGLSIPRQEAETMAFDNWVYDNQCLACHIQSQALVGLSDVDSKLPINLSDAEVMDALVNFTRGSTHPDGHVSNGSAGNEIFQTSLAFWSLAYDLGRPPASPVPDLRPGGIQRYEESHPDLQFNDGAFHSAVEWGFSSWNETSAGYAVRSQSANDTLSLTFTGSWINVGFLGDIPTGKAEIFIDGVSQGVIDTYRRYRQAFSQVFTLADSGPHTLEITVLGQRGPYASDEWVYVDYIDVWDGAAMPNGRFETDHDQVRTSTNWQQSSDAIASGGTFFRDGTNVWFPFTGDSVTFQSVGANWLGQAEIFIDGQSQGYFDQYNPVAITRTLSFAGLGSGPHVLQISSYRGRINADAFITPGTAPFYNPPTATGIIRHEENDPALQFNGTPFNQTSSSWNMGGKSWGSQGYAAWSKTAADTLSLTFDGTWVGLGFITQSNTGLAEIFIDGVSQGVIDTYSRYDDTTAVYYEGLAPGTHTLSLTVLGTRQPHATDNWIMLDYIDVWDGTNLADGVFEAVLEISHTPRLYRSSNWSQSSSADASGGTYLRDGSNVWFPFTGDTVSFQTLAANWLGQVEILIDGQVQGRFNLYDPATTTRTFSFDNLGSGPHVMQINAYRGRALVDVFYTPGTPPFYTEPMPTGIVRYEEDDVAIQYNGVPFAQTRNTWNMGGKSWASDGYGAWSRTAADTLSFTFDGTWVGLGFITQSNTGLAEIFIDGASQGIIDTYSRYDDVTSIYYDSLITGTHTLSLTVLGTRQPYATDNWIMLDYIDVWDGTTLPDGTFETVLEASDTPRLYRSSNWSQSSSADASGGTYLRDGSNIWFPFTGDTVSFQTLAANWLGEVEILIDGQLQGRFNLYHPTTISRTFSFDGLGSGPHVMHINAYRGRALVDLFHTPGTPPFYTTPVRTGIVRYEEDDVALRYNGVPFAQTKNTWNMGNANHISSGYGTWSKTAADTLSLTFDGTWVGLGLLVQNNAGEAEIFIDGLSQGVIDTYAATANTTSLYYDNLITGTHTISITVLGSRNPSSRDNWVHLDYIDVWDGTPMPEGAFEAVLEVSDNPRVYRSSNWRSTDQIIASGGQHLYDGSNLWFPFTGDSVTFQGIASSWVGQVDIRLDGVSQGTFDLSNPTTITRTFSITSLVHGPHVLQVAPAAGRATADLFYTPALTGQSLRSAPAKIVPEQAPVPPVPSEPEAPGPSIDTAPPIDAVPIERPDQAGPTDTEEVPLAAILAAVSQPLPDYLVDHPSLTAAAAASPPGRENPTWLVTESVTNTLINMADYLLAHRRADNTWLGNKVGASIIQWWWNDDSGYSPSFTAYNIRALGTVYDLTGDIIYRDALVDAAQATLAYTYTTNHSTALHQIIGYHAALPYVSDDTLATQMETRMLAIGDYLRTQQKPNGGWSRDASVTTADSLPTAGVLFALSLLDPASTDPALLAATRYLLRHQRADGQWESIYQGSSSRPIMTTTWVNISLPWIYEVLSSYSLNVNHHVPLQGTQALTETFNIEPATTYQGNQLIYQWAYNQSPLQQLQTLTYASVLTDMRPGEVRAVSNGTLISYTIESGSNSLSLPPRFVQSPHIIRVAPAAQKTAPGTQRTYAVLLFNPGPTSDTYTLAVNGLPAAWIQLPLSVTLAAGAIFTASLNVDIPLTADLSDYTFNVVATTSTQGQDQAGALLTVAKALDITLSPEETFSTNGEVVTYSVTITNMESVARTYTLGNDGLTDSVVTLPPTITVAAGDALNVPLTVTPYDAHGPHPFTVVATTTETGAAAQDNAALTIVGSRSVTAALLPAAAVGGPGTPVTYSLRITNTGELVDTYALSLTLPADWTYQIAANGRSINQLSLTPHTFNATTVQLLITPTVTATAGDYDLTVLVQSQVNPHTQTEADGILTIANRGVQVTVQPSTTTLAPTESGTWQVLVTNLGTTADTYALSVNGIIAGSAQFSAETVTLSPGQSQSVQLTADNLHFALPQEYRFEVAATSQTDNAIQDRDTADVLFTGYETVTMSWLPMHQSITDTLTANYMLLVTNTGNIDTTYHISITAPGLNHQLEIDDLFLPPHMAAAILVIIKGTAPGTYAITAQADSLTTSATASSTATLTIAVSNHPPDAVNDAVTTTEDTAVTINILANDSDPDNDPLTVTALTPPAHGTAVLNGDDTVTYTPDPGYVGSDTFTYTIQDSHGGTDTAVVTISVQAQGGWLEVCSPDNQTVEVIGTGMGHARATTNNPAVLTIADAASLNSVLAQVVVNNYSGLQPDKVILSSSGETLDLLTPSSSSAGYNYEAFMQSADGVTAEVVGTGNASEQTPRAFIAYLFRDGDGSQASSGRLIHADVYEGSHSELLTIPTASFSRDVVITFAVSDMDADNRTAVLQATAGGVSQAVTVIQPNHGDELLLYDLVLPHVPGSVDTITVTLSSPVGTGDSLYWSGVNITVPCQEVTATGRVTDGLQSLYTFQEGSGPTVSDVSGVGTPLDLTIANEAAVHWLADGGLSIDTPTVIASAGPATKLIEAAQATDELTIEAWVLPANTTQDGPARLVTLSPNTSGHNAMLGQGQWSSLPSDTFIGRLRTDEANTTQVSPAGSAITDLTHVVYTRDAAGVTRLYVDGVPVQVTAVGGDLSTWDAAYPLALANEITQDRPWRGQLHLVAFYNQALNPTQVAQNFSAGSGTTPPAPPAPGTRITQNLQTLYTFQEGSGSSVTDVSGVGSPLTLTINDTTAVTWLPGGGLSVDSAAVISSGSAATKIIEASQATNELTVELWVRPANINQDGPARVVTLSPDSTANNVTIGQGQWASLPKDVYIGRVSTSAGHVQTNTPPGTTTTDLTHVVYTRDALGVIHMYVDGTVVSTNTALGDLSTWNPAYPLTLANEPTGDRGWIGELHLVAVYNRALEASEVNHNFGAGSGTIP